jgi:hypothetical protein
MPHALTGVLHKLNRASEHLDDLDGMVESLGDTDIYETLTERHRDGGLVIRVRNVNETPPELAVRIGECVYNARSALDHLAFALTAAYTDPLPEKLARASAFPIVDAGWRFRGERGSSGVERRLKGMSHAARAAIERVQPYHRRNPRLKALWRLEELSNIDKHRLPHLTAFVGSRSRFQITGGGVARIDGIRPTLGAPIREKAEVARIWGEFDLQAGVQVRADIRPEVVFDQRGEATSVRGASVCETLAEILVCIGFDVLPEFEAELAQRFPGVAVNVAIEVEEAGTFSRGPDHLWSARQAAHMQQHPSDGVSFRTALLDVVPFPPPE